MLLGFWTLIFGFFGYLKLRHLIYDKIVKSHS